MITGCNAVYYQHFGLDGPPFQFTPALKTLYMGRGYREALAALRWGLLHEPSGFTLFTCETGVGKTTLVHRLLSEKYDTVRAALIVNPAIGFGPLLEDAVRQLGIECGSAGAAECQETLGRALASVPPGHRLALVIDDAQELPDDSLERLRLLANYDRADEKRFQLILVGDHSLEMRLLSPRFRSLNERIGARAGLSALDRSERLEYVDQLLRQRGGSIRRVFFRRPLAGLLEASEGVPRRINLLCHNAMLAAYSEGARKVRLSHAQQTLAEVKLGKRLDNGEAAGAGIAPGFATGPGGERISRAVSGSRWALAIASTAGIALLCVVVVGGPRIHAGQTRLRQVKNVVVQPLEGLVGQLENLRTLRQTLLEALPKVESAAGQLAARPGVRSSARRPNSTLHGSDIKPNNLSSPEPASREAGRKSTLTASPRSASTLRHNHAIRARTKSGIEAPPTAHSSKGPTGSPSDGGAAPGNGLPSGVSSGRRGSAGQQGREVAAEPGSLVKKPFHRPASLAVVSPPGRELKARSRFLGRVLNPNLPAASKSLVCQHPTREWRQVALRPPRWVVARCGDALLKLAKSYYGSAA